MHPLKIKKVDYLPDWFSAQKYDAVEGFTATDWYQQLSIRLYNDYSLRTWLINKKKHPDTPIPDIFSDIRNNPIVDFKNSPHLKDRYMDGVLHEIEELEPIYMNPIRKLTSDDLRATLQNNNVDLAKQGCSSGFADTSMLFGPVICINPYMSNETLFDEFRKFIIEYKSENNIPDNRKDKHKLTYKKWFKWGLLPFIDIHHWEIENSYRLPKRLLLTAVSPYGDIGESSMQNSTAVAAIELFGSQSTFSKDFDPSTPSDNYEYYTPTMHELVALSASEVQAHKKK